MIHLPASVRVYLCLSPCDMRKSFDSLHALVREQLQLDAFAGHLFVFVSRRRNRARFHIPIAFCDCRVPVASPLRTEIAAMSPDDSRR
jgi:transposase